MSITERIRKLCEENNITINRLEKELGIGRGNIGRWHKHKPNSGELLKVANRFNVSAEYLLTGEEPKIDLQLFAEKKPAPESGNEPLTVDEIKKAFRGRPFEELTDILAALTVELQNTEK